jgi:hypothetical protein
MNYTGDRLNFGAAAERAKAEGLAVEMVVVAGGWNTALQGNLFRIIKWLDQAALCLLGIPRCSQQKGRTL